MKATFPQATVICTYRHPIDVYSSYRRRREVAQVQGASAKTLAWLNLQPESFCRLYCADLQRALAVQRADPAGFLLIRTSGSARQDQV